MSPLCQTCATLSEFASPLASSMTSAPFSRAPPKAHQPSKNAPATLHGPSGANSSISWVTNTSFIGTLAHGTWQAQPCIPGNTASSSIIGTATTMYLPPSAMAYSLSLPKTNSLKYWLILSPSMLPRLLMDGTSSTQIHLSTHRKPSLSCLPPVTTWTPFLTTMQCSSTTGRLMQP
jgi:hypothetical protein